MFCNKQVHGSAGGKWIGAERMGGRKGDGMSKEVFTWRLAGVTAAGALVCGNAALGIFYRVADTATILPIAAACVTGGLLLDRVFTEGKYEKLFRACGLEKDGKIPLVIRKIRTGNETTLVVHMPEGISQKQFEQKQLELEQALNCKIEFSYNKNLIMKLIEMNLKNKYDYEFEECESPTESLIGYTHEGKFYFDIDKATQTIVAGEPNSGKSSLLRTMLLSLILSKHDIDLHLIDFQAIELGIFQDCRKVKSYGETPEDFEKLIDEMETENTRRLKLFASVRKQRYIQKLSVWNKFYPEQALPYKIVVIDEFARLAEKQYESLLDRFRSRVAMDRKVGILYIISLQRPDVKVISGSIKGSMNTRIAFKVVTDTDSEVIIDIPGAEKIKQQGRCIMKYLGEMKEVQCLYLENEQVRTWLKKYKAYKSRDELAAERQREMKALRDKCINPYLKGGAV